VSPAATALDGLTVKMTSVRSARAWVFNEQLREIFGRKQVNVVRASYSIGVPA
jgi:hypothetical protein